MNDSNEDPNGAAAKLRIVKPAQAGPVLEFAARELAEGLGATYSSIANR